MKKRKKWNEIAQHEKFETFWYRDCLPEAKREANGGESEYAEHF